MTKKIDPGTAEALTNNIVYAARIIGGVDAKIAAAEAALERAQEELARARLDKAAGPSRLKRHIALAQHIAGLEPTQFRGFPSPGVIAVEAALGNTIRCHDAARNGGSFRMNGLAEFESTVPYRTVYGHRDDAPRIVLPI